MTRRSYIGGVTVLMLLSALLSALTGMGTSTRAHHAEVAVSRPASAQAPTPARTARVATSFAASLPVLAARGQVAALPVWRLVAPAPLYLSRRRE